ncbi:MAG: acyl-CoA dehydrogenase family protein [Acidimicrobiales bacterium]
MPEADIDLETFEKEARVWLEANAELKPREDGERRFVWGEGEFDVAVFHNLGFDEEKAVIDEAAAWTRKKAEAGYHCITWEPEWGGLGLSNEHEKLFNRLEADYRTPTGHETHSVTTHLMAPTIRLLGTDWQKEQWVKNWISATQLCCQLFSEPAAGSDLANVALRAERDGDEWILNGQKVWSSGAQFAEWGMCVCRTNPELPKHKGITVFAIPLQNHDGVEVRQIKQMSGGTSFNEVFLTDCRIPDSYRVGDVGEGWKVALTILGFERSSSGTGGDRVGGSWRQFRALVEHFDLAADPVRRDEIMKLYVQYRVMGLNIERVKAQLKAGQAPGAEGSIGKLYWTESMTMMSDVLSKVLGPKLLADSGEWGTFGWNEHIMGAPGYRIAGGSDEIQRNIIGERVLGLPGEPRVDKDVPYRDVPR